MAVNETTSLLTVATSRAQSTKAVPVPTRPPLGITNRGWKTRPLFSGTGTAVDEQIAANLFSVVESPKYIFSAESQFQSEQEIVEACGGAGPLPFLLKGSKIYTLLPLKPDSRFAAALNTESVPARESFASWLSAGGERSRWAIELLDRSLRRHAWKRGLRFDECHSLFYFTRSKPKKLWWETSGKIAEREVTAPHLKSYCIESGQEVEFQCGWKHEAVRAGFVQAEGQLFLRFEPAWFLTELDGKTPATKQAVAPVGAVRPDSSDAEFTRTLRFWSAVFAKGHRELRMETGAAPIRVRLTPAPGAAPRIIAKDRMSADDLALTGMEEDRPIPELGPVEV